MAFSVGAPNMEEMGGANSHKLPLIFLDTLYKAELVVLLDEWAHFWSWGPGKCPVLLPSGGSSELHILSGSTKDMSNFYWFSNFPSPSDTPRTLEIAF